MPACIYQIRLAEGQDTEAFAKFMREEYLPAIPRTPTRVGGVTGLALLQLLPDVSRESGGADNAPEFFLHVAWNGLPGCLEDAWVSDEEVLRKLESFGTRVKLLGSYREHRE